MTRAQRYWMVGGVIVLAALTLGPLAMWASLRYQPAVYAKMAQTPGKEREQSAKHFVASGLQLRNDIENEPEWEAVFTDKEVNAWLAEDLMKDFAGEVPPQVREPRVAFETGLMTLAFQFDQAPLKAVVWVVAEAEVPEPNTLELSLLKIRAGALPVPADEVLDNLVQFARQRGADVKWERVEGIPRITMKYQPSDNRADVLLEQIQLRAGSIRLVGKSDRARGRFDAPKLPSASVIQSNLRKRTRQGISEFDEPPVESVTPAGADETEGSPRSSTNVPSR